MKKYDVVIIGFGPTGGTLANLLALHGFSILVLEKEKSFYPLPRAVHFDDEVMRVFETIGITNTFLKHTIINKGTKFVDKKNRVILDWPRPREITENGWGGRIIDPKTWKPIETFEGPSFWGHERLYLPDEERMKFRNKRLETASEGKQAPLFIDCPWLYSNTINKK